MGLFDIGLPDDSQKVAQDYVNRNIPLPAHLQQYSTLTPQQIDPYTGLGVVGAPVSPTAGLNNLGVVGAPVSPTAGLNNLGLDAATLAKLNPQELETLRQYGLISSDLQPSIQAGQQNISSLMAGAGITDNTQGIKDITGSSSYLAAKSQGEDAIRQAAAAGGKLNSGDTAVNLGSYSPQLLITMLNDRYKSLGNLVNLGQKSSALQTGFGTSTSNLLNQQIMNDANIKAGQNIQSGANTAANIRGATGVVGSVAGML
jgi:hypothetical protein